MLLRNLKRELRRIGNVAAMGNTRPMSSSSMEAACARLPNIREQINQERKVGDSATVRGWIRTVRSQKDFVFLSVNDGSNIPGMQVVFGEGVDPAALEASKKITVGTSVVATGKLVRNERKELDSPEAFELHATSLVSVGTSPSAATVIRTPGQPSTQIKMDPYPLQKKYQSLEFLRELPHLRLRTNTYGAVMRIRSQATVAIHEFFHGNGFLSVQTPVITPLDCEGAGELFEVVQASASSTSSSTSSSATPSSSSNSPSSSNSSSTPAAATKPSSFFGTRAYLSVSGQLYAEIAASAATKVYTFGPTFRAENSHTTRHLAEFWMLEPEIAFCDLKQACDWTEESIKYMTFRILDNCLDDLTFLEGRYKAGHVDALKKLVATPFARVTYAKAIEILAQAVAEGKVSFQYPVAWGESLQSEHERYLAEKHFEGPVFVTNYPAATKPFYMREDDASTYVDPNGPTVACMDLLVPGIGELCGGSQREERPDVLLKRMKSAGLDVQQYKWYLDLRCYGGVPHAGWGMGFERFIAYVAGIDNVRDTTLVPRAPGLLAL